MAWDIQFRDGIYLPQLDWWLDAHQPVARSFVSHAHSDHTALHREILCSAGTARLMQARLPGERTEHILPFEQTERFSEDCAVTLYPAGHIFGSAQILLNHAAHGSLLYTGDFKLRRGLSAEPCATPHAETVIMETTFGRPQYVFPPTDQVLRDIAHFCRECLDDGQVPVLFGYSLGKSQELLSGLAAAQLPVMLHPQTHRLTQVYEQLGLHFPPYREFEHANVSGHVVICPPQARDSTFVRKIPRARTAVITGWAIDPTVIYRYQCDAGFPLSDHADFPDLLRFVDAVNPKRVLTVHGFTTDFAQTLRERGIEAWALDRDNQLELEIPSRAGLRPALANHGNDKPGSSSIANVAVQPAEGGSETRPTPAVDRFAYFVSVADAVKATTRKLEKIALLKDYLSQLSPENAAIAATFLTGRAFPQRDQRNLTLGWSVIKRAVLEVAGVTEADYYAAYHRYADAGDATAAVLQVGTPLRGVRETHEDPNADGAPFRQPLRPAQDPEPVGGESRPCPRTSLADIHEFFAQIADARGIAPKLDLFRERLRMLSADEARYLVKIITGDLRIGLKEGLLEEAIAAAADESLERVREANMLCGDIAAVTRATKTNTLNTIELRVFNPLQFMLASPEPTAEAIVERFRSSAGVQPAHESAGKNAGATPTIWLEEKYDGIRCQLHKADGRVELYSRDLNRITDQFPDLTRAAAEIAGDFIADGELLAWRDGRALPFAELQKRLGRKGGDDFFLGSEIPVSISFYDLLWLNGRSLLKEPLSRRRELLEGLIGNRGAGFMPAIERPTGGDKPRPTVDPRTEPFRLAPVQHAHTAQDIEAAFVAARARGNEGLMAKDPNSFYTPGRRGLAWLKLKKAYATLDVVVVGVEYGHGKRRDVLSDYTFAIRDEENGNRLLTVGKAYSGLTDVEIAALTQHFLDHTLEVSGRYRFVVPDTVIEVAFDIIQPSKRHQSGFALRFPRIARIRTDKTPAEIDTLETCRRLASASFASAVGEVSDLPHL
jgi:DNA ligase-1